MSKIEGEGEGEKSGCGCGWRVPQPHPPSFSIFSLKLFRIPKVLTFWYFDFFSSIFLHFDIFILRYFIVRHFYTSTFLYFDICIHRHSLYFDILFSIFFVRYFLLSTFLLSTLAGRIVGSRLLHIFINKVTWFFPSNIYLSESTNRAISYTCWQAGYECIFFTHIFIITLHYTVLPFLCNVCPI